MDRITSVQLYIRVVETGSFSRAAVELGITQPTATKAVAAMEQRLGARLLHRSSRGVTPTEVGAIYYDKCKRIAHEIDEADNLATLLQSRVGGTLRVSTSVAFGRRVLVPRALRYMALHPGVTIDLSFEDRYVDLVQQGVDLAIRMGRLADSSLGARYLGTNPWVTVASPPYLARAGTPTARLFGGTSVMTTALTVPQSATKLMATPCADFPLELALIPMDVTPPGSSVVAPRAIGPNVMGAADTPKSNVAE